VNQFDYVVVGAGSAGTRGARS